MNRTGLGWLLLNVLAVAAACSNGADRDPGSSDGGGGAATGEADQNDRVSSFEGCTNPKPVLEDHETGQYRCLEGHLYRAEVKSCPSSLPRDAVVEWPEPSGSGGNFGAGGMGGAGGDHVGGKDECEKDTDCPHLAYCELTYREPIGDSPAEYSRVCVQGCTTDEDCGGAVCVCGELVGECGAVNQLFGCNSDADCYGEAACLSNAKWEHYSWPRFACQLEGDNCQSDEDCDEGAEFCALRSSYGRTCERIITE